MKDGLYAVIYKPSQGWLERQARNRRTVGKYPFGNGWFFNERAVTRGRSLSVTTADARAIGRRMVQSGDWLGVQIVRVA